MRMLLEDRKSREAQFEEREAEATASGRRREAAATASDRRREGSDARANGNAHEAHWKVSASGGDENKCFTRGGRTR